jgi:hypothetical protein
LIFQSKHLPVQHWLSLLLQRHSSPANMWLVGMQISTEIIYYQRILCSTTCRKYRFPAMLSGKTIAPKCSATS